MVVGFERSVYTVGEGDGQVELCVNITVPRRQDIGAITFNLTVETQDGSAGIAWQTAIKRLNFGSGKFCKHVHIFVISVYVYKSHLPCFPTNILVSNGAYMCVRTFKVS